MKQNRQAKIYILLNGNSNTPNETCCHASHSRRNFCPDHTRYHGLHIGLHIFLKISAHLLWTLFHSFVFSLFIQDVPIPQICAVLQCCMTLLLHFLFLPLHFLAFCLLLWLWVSTFHNTSARIISLGPLLLHYSELWNPFTAPCRRHFYCSGLPELSHINWQSSYCFLFPLFGFDFNFFLSRMSYYF